MSEELEYKQYKIGARCHIRSIDKYGEPYESLPSMNVISVFVDGERKCRYFKFDDVEILNANASEGN